MQKIAWVFVLSSCPAMLFCSSAKVAPLESAQGSGGARGGSPDGAPDVAIVAPPPGIDIPVSMLADEVR